MLGRPLVTRIPLVQFALPSSIWLGIHLVERFDWGEGDIKAVALLFLLIGTAAITFRARQGARIDAEAWNQPLLLIGVVLFMVHLGYLIEQIGNPHLFDGATTTLAAARAFLSGLNPIALPLDRAASPLMGDPAFAGYKYLPVTVLTYLPLGAGLDKRGLLLTNLVLELAILWLVYGLARRLGTRTSGLLAVVFYLSLPIVIRQSFGKGVTDLAAVLPMLAALSATPRRPWLAGFWVGLSISAKVLPGALLLPCAFPGAGHRRAYIIGLALGLLPALCVVALSPIAFYDNIVLFNLARSPDSTSWLAFAPPEAASAMRLVFAAALLSLSAFMWRSTPDLLARCGLLCAMIILTILAGPAAHHNYQLWWLPLISVLVGVAVTHENIMVAQRRNHSSEFKIEPRIYEPRKWW